MIAFVLYGIIFLLAQLGMDFLPAAPGADAKRLRSLLKEGEEIEAVAKGTLLRVSYGDRSVYLTLKGLSVIVRDPFYCGKINGEDLSFSGKEELELTENPRILLKASLACDNEPDREALKKQLLAGRNIVLFGKLTCSPVPGNPGQFDQRRSDWAENVFYRMHDGMVSDVSGTKNSLFWIDPLRSVLSGTIGKIADQEDAGIACSVLLGEKNGLSRENRRIFQNGGISHLLAVSGVHISIFGMSIFTLLRKRRFSFFSCFLCSSGMVLAYCVLVGMSISAERAMIMYFCWTLAQLLGRTYDLPSALSAACILILLNRPGNILQAGFYLSFGCILAMLLVCPLLERKMEAAVGFLYHVTKKNRFFRSRICVNIQKALTVSLGIWLGTLPVCCCFFFQITPYSPVINLVVLPLFPLVMFSALAASAAGILAVPCGILLFAPCHYLLKLYRWICRVSAILPGSVLITGRPAWWKIILYYGLLFLWLKSQPEKKKQLCRERRYAAAFFLGLWLLLHPFRPDFRISFLDVGQGDSILIEKKDHCFLVDCGSSSVTDVWNDRVLPAMKYYGIRRIDAVFLSHGDSDHINGIRTMLEESERSLTGRFRCGGLGIGQIVTAEYAVRYDEALNELVNEALNCGLPVRGIASGESMAVGGNGKNELRLTCLYPGDLSGEDWSRLAGNETSLVLDAAWDSFHFLLMGDLEKDGERLFLEKAEGFLETITGTVILKSGHHGSGNASGMDFLEKVRPSLAVISCGKDNRYGHPAQVLLERLSIIDCPVRRTDLDGAVVFLSE